MGFSFLFGNFLTDHYEQEIGEIENKRRVVCRGKKTVEIGKINIAFYDENVNK